MMVQFVDLSFEVVESTTLSCFRGISLLRIPQVRAAFAPGLGVISLGTGKDKACLQTGTKGLGLVMEGKITS